MKKENFNSFFFLRKYFNIPKKKYLRWCIIRERSQNGEELRLGIAIERTGKYIDIAQRRIFSEISCPLIERRFFPARKISTKQNFIFRTDNGWELVKPKSYFADIYRSSWWHKGIEEERLI